MRGTIWVQVGDLGTLRGKSLVGFDICSAKSWLGRRTIGGVNKPQIYKHYRRASYRFPHLFEDSIWVAVEGSAIHEFAKDLEISLKKVVRQLWDMHILCETPISQPYVEIRD